MAHGVSDVLGEGSSVKMVHQKSQQQQQQQLVQQQQSQQQQQPNVRKSVGVMGSRRIFAPAFKLKVLDSYRNDIDCRGNQRATARKYGIHRRQIQKWLQCEDNLRNSCAETGSAAAAAATGSTVVVPTASVATTSSPILAISSASKPDDGTVTEATVPAVTPAAVTAPALNLSLARLHGDELATQQGSPPLAPHPPHPSHRGSPSTPPQYSPQQAASTAVLPLRVAALGGYPEYSSGPQEQPSHQQRLRRELERRVHMPDMIHYSESRAGPERSYYMVNGESASREGTSEFVVSDAKVYQTLTSYRHHREHRYEMDAGCTAVNGHRGGAHRHEEDMLVNHRQRSPTYEHEKRQCERGGYGDVDSSVEGKAYGMLLAPSMIKTERASPDSVATPGPYESAACSPVTPGGLLSPPFSHQATSTTTINVPTTTTTAAAVATTTTGTILAASSSSNSSSSSRSTSSSSSNSTTTNTSNSPTSVHFESPRRRASASPCLLHVHVHEHAHACPDSEKPIPCLRGQQEKESRETSARGCLKREEEVATSRQEEEEEEVAAEGQEGREEIVTSEKVHREEEEEEEAEEMLDGAVVKEELHLDEDESRLGREEDEDEDAATTSTVGASSVSCTDYQVPPAGSASLGSGPVSPAHDRDNLLYSSSSPSSPRGPGSSGRSSSSCSDSEMDPLDCSSSSQNSSNDLARRRSFSLRFKLDVLDAFHRDAGVAGNQRATARKFGINRRQVQKWLGQETELRGEIALRGNSRQRLGPIQDPSSSGESPVDLRTTGYVVGLHHGGQQDRMESDAYERSPMPPMAPLYCCDVGSSSSASHHSYYHPQVEASAEIDLVRSCTLSCCVDGQGTQSYGTSCYQETGFRGSCCAESQGRLYCYSPREYDTPSNPAESTELISSPLKRQHCTLSCCYDPAASPKRLCLDAEEKSSCQKTPPQETPLCLVKPKRVCDSSPSRTEPVTSTVPTPPASAAAPPPPLPSSKKDAILFKPYLDNPVSKPTKEPVIQRGLSPVSTQLMNNNNCQSICNLNEDSRGHDYALELSLRVPVSWRAHPSPYAEFPQVRSAFVRYPTSPHYT